MDKNPIIETQDGTFIPKEIAQRCPVCNGFGTLKHFTKVCNGCDGKGYVLVPAIRTDGGKYEALKI